MFSTLIADDAIQKVVINGESPPTYNIRRLPALRARLTLPGLSSGDMNSGKFFKDDLERFRNSGTIVAHSQSRGGATSR